MEIASKLDQKLAKLTPKKVQKPVADIKKTINNNSTGNLQKKQKEGDNIPLAKSKAVVDNLLKNISQ